MIAPFHGPVYRAAEPDHTDLSETAAQSRKEAGRFNTSRVGAVYAAFDADTALREVVRSASARPPDPCGLMTIDLHVARMLDLTDDDERERWQLSALDLERDDPRACQAIVERAIGERIEAVRWPSATGAGESVAIFYDHLMPGSRCTVVECREVSLSE